MIWLQGVWLARPVTSHAGRVCIGDGSGGKPLMRGVQRYLRELLAGQGIKHPHNHQRHYDIHGPAFHALILAETGK